MPGGETNSLALPEPEFWARFGEEETSSLEFKERFVKAGKLQDPLVAFANTRGGTVAVGVTETLPRRIVGTRWDQEAAERVQESARITHPPLSVSPHLLDVGGRTVALLRVEPLERGWAQTSDGRLIVRAGPTNRTLVGNELLRFVQERGSDPVEDQRVRGTSVDDLQQDLLLEFMRRRLGRRRIDVVSTTRNLGFTDPGGEVRLAGLLLFGREPQRDNRRFGIDVLRFEGAAGTRVQLRDRQQLTGTLSELVMQADRTIYDEMRRDAVIRGLVREEVPEFPPLALREALLNAVGHRDYSLRGSAVEVRLFDDAIEIESPGTLAGYVTLENLREGQYSRNERVMDAFHVLGLVEEAGTGIDRMYEQMEEALLDPPEFEERSNSFVVRFRGRSVFAAEDRLWVSRFSELGLSADEKVALVYARRQGSVTNEELRAPRRLDATESRAVLQNLVARQLLQPLGRGRGTRYVLGQLALRARQLANLGEQVDTVVAHARRLGAVANRDVRGLLGVDSTTARTMLELAVAQGLLRPVGERRGRRYLPTGRAEEI